MLATFLIESALLFYVVWRYKMTPLMRLVAAILTFLATFQLAEFYVCGGLGMSSTFWSRVGFVAITALPPLGLHLIHVIAKKPERLLVYTAYLTGIAWAVVFGASDWAFSGYECSGNYVIFQLRETLTGPYGLYYYGWLVGGIWSALSFARHATKKVQAALMSMILGYFVFLVPTAAANMIKPETRAGIPSIMCGFAVLFALLLVLRILPLLTSRRDLR